MKSFFRDKKLRKILRNLINRYSIYSNLPDYVVNDVKELLIQNEHFLAIELIAESIYEYPKTISLDDYNEIIRISDIYESYGVSCNFLFLKNIVEKNSSLDLDTTSPS